MILFCFLTSRVFSCLNSTELSLYGDSKTFQSLDGKNECELFNINFGDFGHSFYFTSNSQIYYRYGHECATENDTVIENNTKISFFHGSQHVELCVLSMKDENVTLNVVSAVHPVDIFEIHNILWISLIVVTSILVAIQYFNIFAVRITIKHNVPFVRYVKMRKFG